LVGGGLVVLMAFQFGGVVVLGKTVSDAGLPVPSMLAFRFATSGVLLAAVLTLLRRPKRAARGEGTKLWVLGMAVYAAESALYFTGLGHGSATAVTLLFFTYPVLVALAGFALGRGLPGWLLGGALVASTGGAAIVVATGGGVQIEALGVVFALCSALAYSVYLLGADATLRRTDPLAGAMLLSFAAAAGLALYAVASGQGRLPRGWEPWGAIVGMGALTAGAFVCLFSGIYRLGALRTAIIAAMEPLAVAILASAFLAESVPAGTATGGVLILVGAVAASFARIAGPAEPPVP
jgi:drug/metabolite transporter (DMT)-like permease